MNSISPVSSSDRLRRALEARVEGDVRFDTKTRVLYSTDASLYQIPPVGVVLPRTAEDVATTARLASEEGVALVPRGGGTSLAGQSIGEALIIDFSRYMDAVLEVDAEGRTARVQPGIRLDRLNRALLPNALQFGPDPATIYQCALGGMIGNNACGARSLVYGKTIDHVRSLTCVLADGETVRFGPLSRTELESQPGREGELGRAVRDLVDPMAALIREKYPDIPRRVSGYNFDELIGEGDFNLAKLIVGSEGTLATVVEAELGLVPLPPARALVLLSFQGQFDSIDAVPEILPEHGLSAIEVVDHRVVSGARELLQYRDSAARIAPGALGVLFVEFAGDDMDEVSELARDFARRAVGLPGAPDAGVYVDPVEQNDAWALRRAATGLLYNTTPTRDIKPVEFVEDTGIAPEKLGAYTRRFGEIIEKHGTTSGYFGHAGQGCLHIRVDLDLKRAEDVERMQAIAREVAELVVEFGGSISGEHGDGLSRSEFLPLMFGPELMELHRKVKLLFDPNGLMNPGKIIDPPVMSANQRFGADYHAESPETFFDYSADGGWDRAVEKCNGMAVCRKLDIGTMCPSYMVTREEEHTVRGRANTLREAMRGTLDGMRSPEVKEALSLCLECKACKTECPVGVDMARYKAEFLAQSYKKTGTPPDALFFGRIHELAKAGGLLPGTANLGSRLFGGVMKRAAGVHPERSLPEIVPRPFRKSFRPVGKEGRPPVVLLDDTFHNFFEPAPLTAAATVLERAGFAVELPSRQVCCGRAAISKGLLADARDKLRSFVETVAPRLEAGAMLVGVEPSCILTMRDELPDLVDDPRTALFVERSRTLEELLAETDYEPGRLERKALVHGHCHQKALVGMIPTVNVLGRVEGLDLELLDAGCCGMAGSFGYMRDNYEVSRACAERVLMPAVRELGDGDIAVAPGFSCRTQIKDFGNGRRAIHPAELLAMADRG